MLWSLVGNTGSGKTLAISILASSLKMPLYANYKLNLPNYHPLSLIDVIDLEMNIHIFIDEAYTWLESRSSGRAINKYFSYIIFQGRKTHTNVFLTAQLFGSVDVRFRDLSDVVIVCKEFGNQNIDGKNVPIGFKYKIINKRQGTIKHKKLLYANAIKYFDIYDTFEIIDSSEKEQMEFHLIVRNPNRLKQKVRAISEFIKDDINKITHDSVKYALLINGIPLNYEPYAYIYLKGMV